MFLRNGYRGTSMDEIARSPAVSKQTVYKHFADKERLFSEIVTSTVEEVAEPVHDEVLGSRTAMTSRPTFAALHASCSGG